jgi:hypothetical protein
MTAHLFFHVTERNAAYNDKGHSAMMVKGFGGWIYKSESWAVGKRECRDLSEVKFHIKRTNYVAVSSVTAGGFSAVSFSQTPRNGSRCFSRYRVY